MKKLITLVLAAGLVVSSFAGASAGEFKPSATLINQYEFGNAGENTQNRGLGYNDHFRASLRMDLGFDYIASENLSATFLMRFQENYGATDVTSNGGGTMFDSSMYGSLGVRLAYLDWMIPSTDVQVRLGYQPVALPAFAFGSAVIDTRGAGITISAPINENISVAALWIRAEDGSDNSDANTEPHDDADVFALIGDFSYDGFRVAPWAMYMEQGSNVGGLLKSGTTGNSVDYDATAYWIGASFELSMFDPFTFAIDAYYNDVDVDRVAGAAGVGDVDTDGAYYVGAAVSYKTEWGTPAFKTWYASGDDMHGNSQDFGQPVVLSGAFGATSIMFDDQAIDNGLGSITGGSPAGTWGVILEWADMSFVEKLSHTARVAYIGGTNDLNAAANASLSNLGDDDNVVEFNFNSTYQIYKNLSTSLQVGYLVVDFDRDDNDDEDKDVFRSALSFTYKF